MRKEDRLCEKLYQYGHSDYYGFHMPGHKRNIDFMKNPLPYDMDITEIDGFDDLHHAKDILKEAQERAAKIYHADETSFLINGSTSGLISAILGCTVRGNEILVARNCHKSVYAAVEMNELKVTYIYPVYDNKTGLNGVIQASEIEELLTDNLRKNGKITFSAIVITSPTYDGVVSDVEKIAEIAHCYDIPLIVDEAHGAHFGFEGYFPKNSNQCGADIVIHSLHKTLPSLTQTALIHMNGKLINRKKVRKYIHMLQTSSPSYVLMASMDECIRFLEHGEREFEKYHIQLETLRMELSGKGKTNGLKFLQLVETEKYDPSKIVISTRNTNYNGKQLYQKLLEKYHLQMEMASQEYILAMTTICDTENGFERLKNALFEIDQEMEKNDQKDAMELSEKNIEVSKGIKLPLLEQYCTSAEAQRYLEEFSQNISSIALEKSEGMVSLEYAYVYPPGIPILVPGEIITEDVIELLQMYEEIGFDVEGLREQDQIFILKI